MRRRACCMTLALAALTGLLSVAATAQGGAGIATGSSESSSSARASTAGSAADAAAVAQSGDGWGGTFAVLANRVGPAVVAIRSVLEAPAPPEGETGDAGPSLPPPPVVRLGSGFIVDERGWVVTCANLVAGGGRVEAVFTDDTIARAVSVYYDPVTGLAVVRFDMGARALATLPMDGGPEASLGQPVFVVAPPRGEMESPLLSPGIVGALDLPVSMGSPGMARRYAPMLWATCPMMTANQGAPLVDQEGRVLAVVVSPPREMSDMDGTLTVPIANARALLDGVRAKMSRPRPWLGVYLDDVPEDIRPGGAARVTGLFPAGPADQAGVLGGDFVTAITVTEEGERKRVAVSSVRDLVACTQALEPGAEVTLEIVRDGAAEPLSVPVTLGVIPEDPGAASGGARASFGAEFTDLPAERRELFNVRGGAVLTRVDPEGSAWGMGLRAGDVIVRVAGEPIESAEACEAAVGGALPGSSVTVEFRRLEEGTNKLSSYLVTGRW